jgi:hypothetical protein
MTQTRFQRAWAAVTRRTAVVLLAGVSACSGDDFDRSQVPTITITPVISLPVVVFSWTPAGAQQIQVYRGTAVDGNSANVVWSITASSLNSIESGVEYGRNPPPGGTTIVPAQPLVRGQPYTVQVSRMDPKNAAGSVSGARYRYQNVQTFSLGTIVTPP